MKIMSSGASEKPEDAGCCCCAMKAPKSCAGPVIRDDGKDSLRFAGKELAAAFAAVSYEIPLPDRNPADTLRYETRPSSNAARFPSFPIQACTVLTPHFSSKSGPN